MNFQLTDQQRTALEAALVRERNVRQWRRYQAIRLLAQGQSPRAVAAALGCSVASVYKWAEVWRQRGQDGMREAPRPGRAHRLDARAERQLETWLTNGPRTYGYRAADWTAPLLLEQLKRAGYEVSEHTLRRTLHRLGWRWKHLKYVPGRPALVREGSKGGVIEQVGAALAARAEQVDAAINAKAEQAGASLTAADEQIGTAFATGGGQLGAPTSAGAEA